MGSNTYRKRLGSITAAFRSMRKGIESVIQKFRPPSAV